MNAPVPPSKSLVPMATDMSKRMGFNNFLRDVQGAVPTQPYIAPEMSSFAPPAQANNPFMPVSMMQPMMQPSMMPQSSMVPSFPQMPASSQSIRGGLGMQGSPVMMQEGGDPLDERARVLQQALAVGERARQRQEAGESVDPIYAMDANKVISDFYAQFPEFDGMNNSVAPSVSNIPVVDPNISFMGRDLTQDQVDKASNIFNPGQVEKYGIDTLLESNKGRVGNILGFDQKSEADKKRKERGDAFDKIAEMRGISREEVLEGARASQTGSFLGDIKAAGQDFFDLVTTGDPLGTPRAPTVEPSIAPPMPIMRPSGLGGPIPNVIPPAGIGVADPTPFLTPFIEEGTGIVPPSPLYEGSEIYNVLIPSDLNLMSVGDSTGAMRGEAPVDFASTAVHYLNLIRVI